MATTLQGKTPGGADATYKWLIHAGAAGPLPADAANAITIGLGDGTDLPLSIWQGGMKIAGNLALHTGAQTLTSGEQAQVRDNANADVKPRSEERAPRAGAAAVSNTILTGLLYFEANEPGTAGDGYVVTVNEVGGGGQAALVSYDSGSATISVDPSHYDGITRDMGDLVVDIDALLDYATLDIHAVAVVPALSCPTGWVTGVATTDNGEDPDVPAEPGQRWLWPAQGRVWVATGAGADSWEELVRQGGDFAGATVSATALAAVTGSLTLGDGATLSQLVSGATGFRIWSLPDRTGTLVTLNGDQTFTDAIAFAGAVAVNGQLTAPNQGFTSESGVLTKSLGRRLMPFIDARSTRQIIETFVAGTTADGSVGEWGWSTAAEGTGALSYQQATHVPIGRKLRFLTGTVAGQRIYIAGRPSLATGADSHSAITFVFNLTNTYTWADMRLRFGWSASTVPYSGGSDYAMVEYDASVDSSWRYRFDPSSGGSGEVISAIGAHNAADNNSRAQAVTLVGAVYNERKLGGQAGHARIIVTTFNAAGAAAYQHSVEVNLATAGALFNVRPYVELATLTNAAKSVELSMVASDFSVVLAMASNGGPM